MVHFVSPGVLLKLCASSNFVSCAMCVCVCVKDYLYDAHNLRMIDVCMARSTGFCGGFLGRNGFEVSMWMSRYSRGADSLW